MEELTVVENDLCAVLVSDCYSAKISIKNNVYLGLKLLKTQNIQFHKS